MVFGRAWGRLYAPRLTVTIKQASCRRNIYNRFDKQRYQSFNQRPAVNVLRRWAAQPTFYYQVGGIGVGAGTIYVYNLETVEVSGRRRFNIVSDETVKSLTKSMEDQIISQYRHKILPQHDRRHVQVERVLQRLIPNSGLSGEDWMIKVIDDPNETNAFVLPGGKVYIFTGMLKICADDDGIASVLGHEIAHNVASHSAERMSQSVILLISQLFAFALGIDPGFGNALLNLVFSMPGSRKQEAEADYIGLLMMARSCFRPEAAVELWRRMEKEAGYSPPQFLSTHPTSKNRAVMVESWLPEARDKLNQSDCAATIGYNEDFHSFLDGVS